MISIDDFKKVEMRIGTILSAEYIEGADKLLKLTVDFGLKPRSDGTTDLPPTEVKEEREVRQILAGIREYYSPEQLVGKQCPFVTNLAPRTMRGLVSEGMILAVKTKEGGAMILHPEKPTEAGNLLS